MDGYQKVFLRTDLLGLARAQALELLARFPADAGALNDAVMAEVRRLLVHQQDGAGLQGPVTSALTKHDHPFAREMLLHVARFGPVESVRAGALRGMARWKDDPEVATLLNEKMNSGSEQERKAAMRASGRTIPRSGPKAKERELFRGGK